MSPRQLTKVVGIILATIVAGIFALLAASGLGNGVSRLFGSGALSSLVGLGGVVFAFWCMYQVVKYGAARAQQVMRPSPPAGPVLSKSEMNSQIRASTTTVAGWSDSSATTASAPT